MNGHATTVKLLIDNGADINLGDEFTTPFNMAKKTGMHSLEGDTNANNTNSNKKTT